MHLRDLKGLTFEPTDGHHQAFDLSLDTWNHFPRRARDASATTFLFGSFHSNERNVFGEEVEEWNSNCPPFLPGGRSHKHGFCRKLDPVKQEFYPPANPEPRPGVQPTASHRSHPQKPRVHVEKPQVPFELPAQTIREEQKLVVQEPQAPFTAQSPQKTQATEAIRKMTREQHKEMKHKDKIEAPFVGPEAAEDVSPPPSAATAPPVEVDPGEPRPPLIVEQKTSVPSKGPEIGIVEDDPSPEEELLEDPEAKKLLNKLTEEAVQQEEQKAMEQGLPKNPPGTPKAEDQAPFWPPRGGTAPPMQPIPPRPGEADYYGWTPPSGPVPYSPPWPGGAPLTAVDRVEAVAAEVGNEASAAAHSVEDAADALLNTPM